MMKRPFFFNVWFFHPVYFQRNVGMPGGGGGRPKEVTRGMGYPFVEIGGTTNHWCPLSRNFTSSSLVCVFFSTCYFCLTCPVENLFDKYYPQVVHRSMVVHLATFFSVKKLMVKFCTDFLDLMTSQLGDLIDVYLPVFMVQSHYLAGADTQAWRAYGPRQPVVATFLKQGWFFTNVSALKHPGMTIESNFFISGCSKMETDVHPGLDGFRFFVADGPCLGSVSLSQWSQHCWSVLESFVRNPGSSLSFIVWIAVARLFGWGSYERHCKRVCNVTTQSNKKNFWSSTGGCGSINARLQFPKDSCWLMDHWHVQFWQGKCRFCEGALSVLFFLAQASYLRLRAVADAQGSWQDAIRLLAEAGKNVGRVKQPQSKCGRVWGSIIVFFSQNGTRIGQNSGLPFMKKHQTIRWWGSAAANDLHRDLWGSCRAFEERSSACGAVLGRGEDPSVAIWGPRIVTVPTQKWSKLKDIRNSEADFRGFLIEFQGCTSKIGCTIEKWRDTRSQHCWDTAHFSGSRSIDAILFWFI